VLEVGGVSREVSLRRGLIKAKGPDENRKNADKCDSGGESFRVCFVVLS